MEALGIAFITAIAACLIFVSILGPCILLCEREHVGSGLCWAMFSFMFWVALFGQLSS